MDESFVKRQAILGLRGSFGGMFEKHIEDDPKNWKLVTADTSTSAGLSRLIAKYPDNFVECGIAEQAAMGIATGLALDNIDTYVGSFAPFIVGRAWEQIRLAAYMSANLTVFGFGAGLGLSYLGFTHCSLEDVSLISCMPNTTIFEPSTPTDIYNALMQCGDIPGLKYIRITGEGAVHKTLYTKGEFFGPNIRFYPQDGENLVLCCGHMASRIIREIEVDGLKVDLITVNKLDEKSIRDNISSLLVKYKKVHCVHESYENLLYKICSKILPQDKLTAVNPKKIFCKPGNFDFVAQKTNFNFSVL